MHYMKHQLSIYQIFGELSGVKEGTMRTVINSLLEKGIVTKVKGNNKSKILIFQKYMNVFLK